MTKLVFLLEERSMQVFLEAFLPRLDPTIDFICINHEGKRDLERSIPRKLKAWPNASFIILCDNDSTDCHETKEKLKRCCLTGKREDTLIRLACQELESWFIGASDVLATVYNLPKLSLLGRKPKYRNPDSIQNPSLTLGKLIPGFQKMDCARRMGMAMELSPEKNRSSSFRVFLTGIRKTAGRQTDNPIDHI